MDHVILEIGLALALIGFAVALAAKLKLSNVPFLIIIGMIVGPHAPQIGVFDFRFIETGTLITFMGQLGVLFLLFYLGLEANVTRLIESGPSILTGGSIYIALNFALGQLGTPYRWGAEGPDSFDCSGLVQAAYAAAGITLPRVAQQQFDAGPAVPPGAPLQPGDLVFFGNDTGQVEHVGMVSGPGLMVDAPFTGAVVRFDGYQRASYLGATRPVATQAAVDAAAPTSAVASGSSSVFAVVPDQPGSPTGGELFFTKSP
jgi:hypothetical protein